ncbi:MAG: TetR/AcrR family transcriptional regulator [Candidatus Binatia bacterium]
MTSASATKPGARVDASPGDQPAQNSKPVKEDGRTLRSASTRRAVAEAYLNLLSAGALRPTARAIAAEAGVSERAVFRHFQDMETLHSEAALLQIQRMGRDLPDPAPLDGPLSERTSLLAGRWCALNERVTPVRRVALLHEPFSPEIARRLAWIRGLARTELECTFAGELAVCEDASRPRIVAALAVAVSWESWNEIRTRHGLEPDAALRTVTSMLTAILAGAAAD